jgi:hypothetical protein
MGLTDKERREIEIVIAELEKELAELKKKLDTTPLKDWQIELGKIFNFTPTMGTNGKATVLKYIDDLNASAERLSAVYGDKTISDMLGISELDQAENRLSDIQSRLQRMFEFNGSEPFVRGDDSVDLLLAELEQAQAERDALYENDQYQKYLSDLNREHAILQMSNGGREKAVFLDQMKEAGITEDRANELWGIQQENDRDKSYVGLKEELDLRMELLGLSKEEARLKELTIRLGDEARAKELYALEQEIQKTEALKDALETLKEAGISLAASSLVDFAYDLGKAFQDGTVSSDEFSDALKNMLRSLIDAMPQLLLNVGLQLISAGQWQAGLAFIGASGLMSFISGLVSEAEDNGRNDEYEKLKRIQQQITDLIAAQKDQDEYYTVKRRQLNAQNTMNVNDAIITPRGIVNTNPEDYIIATKHPETLMGGGAAPVNITIINNTPATITQQEGINEDGARQITLLIDQVVQNGLAGGKYDRAMVAMNRRAAGRHQAS